MRAILFRAPARSLMAAALSLAGFVFVAVVFATAQSASAQSNQTIACFSEETGVWTNAHATRGEISRIEVESHCEGIRRRHRARVFTKCAPRDCSWGWTRGEKRGSGKFIAVFTTYSAYRFVEMKVNGERMHVYVTNDFHDRRKMKTAASFVLKRHE